MCKCPAGDRWRPVHLHIRYQIWSLTPLYLHFNLCVCFGSCAQSMMCPASSNSRCLMPNVSRTSTFVTFYWLLLKCIRCIFSFCSQCVKYWLSYFSFSLLPVVLTSAVPFNLTSCVCLSLSASSKTISGLLEFDSKTEAVEVLTVLNHYQIRIPSKCVWKTPPVLQTLTY